MHYTPTTHQDTLLSTPQHITNLFCIARSTYTGKLCHRGKCHSGNCHSGERWMSRPFVHSGNLNFKHTLTNDLVFHIAWKRIICHFIKHKEAHVVDRTIRNVVFAFIWFSFATVYGRLPHPPLSTMAIATLAIATVSLGGTISLCTACLYS